MLVEFHETLWISGIIQLPISGSEFQGGWGVSTWWILCVKQQQFEMGKVP